MNRMLAVQNTPSFISRIFTDACGRQFRLTFLVSVVDGVLKGRLISALPLTKSLSGKCIDPAADVTFSLPIFCFDKKFETPYTPAYVPVVSPYFSLDFLINSQPTRAPSSR